MAAWKSSALVSLWTLIGNKMTGILYPRGAVIGRLVLGKNRFKVRLVTRFLTVKFKY